MTSTRFQSLGAAILTALTAIACGGGTPYNDPPDAAPPGTPDAPVGPVKVLKRASKSGTVAITGDDKTVAMVNPEHGSITTFDAETQTVKATLATGAEPQALVIHPDDDTLFVANRADATVVKVTGLGGATLTIAATVQVGAEPTGLALSPTGATLYVTEFAESRVAVIDTATMQVVGSIPVDRPRAIAVTNNGDQSDADEAIVVPAFYGEATGTEATDTSRQGRVHVFAAGDRHELASITLAPIDSGFAPSTAAADAATVPTSPNQLWAAGIVGQRVFIPSVSASPAGPVDFQANIQPVAYVVDLGTGAEDRGLRGTANLARLVRDQVPTTGPRFFLADLVDVAFVGDKVAYYASRGGDVIQKVVYDEAGPTLGLPFNYQIDLNVTPAGSAKPCQNPTGIVTAHVGGRAYVNCWVTRQLGVIDLGQQALITTIPSATISTDRRGRRQDGKRFYFTGRGRWSKGGEGWSSCGSCHPDGLTDNVTWVFGAGPRQTISQDGSFSHGAQAGKRRVFNFTALFDEHHDFERNVRNVSGGIGVITKPKSGNNADCGNIANEASIPLTVDAAAGAAIDGLGKPLKVHNDTPVGDVGCKLKDWDEVDEFVKTIRPVGKLRKLDQAQVDAGRVLFSTNGGCAKCHGGAGWTQSRRFFEPSESRNTALATEIFTKPAAWPANFSQHSGATQITLEPSGPGPREVSCVIRNTETFGSAELEKNENGTLAVGAKGYNIPSLYGLAVGAPYLHHGGAKTLEALFSESAWQKHTEAGAGNFLPNATERAQLIAFLLSIDATTTEIDPPANFDGCPTGT